MVSFLLCACTQDRGVVICDRIRDHIPQILTTTTITQTIYKKGDTQRITEPIQMTAGVKSVHS